MKPYLIFAACMVVLSIVLGAFGAHAWKDLLIGHESTFETAHSYHITQSLGLLTICAIVRNRLSRSIRISMSLIAIGLIFFSGSLYLLSFPEIFSGAVRKVLGPITPIGGLFMILGWLVFAFSIYRDMGNFKSNFDN